MVTGIANGPLKERMAGTQPAGGQQTVWGIPVRAYAAIGLKGHHSRRGVGLVSTGISIYPRATR